MEKLKIYITRKIPSNGVKMLKKAGFSVEMNNSEDKILSKKELIRKIKNKDVLLCFLSDKIDKEILLSSQNLKMVSNYAVGFDNIDIKTASDREILVTNTSGTSSSSVAEHALALIFALKKRLSESDKFVRSGRYKFWKPSLMISHSLQSGTLGIIGLGRIGTELAKKALCIGMRVIYHTRTRKPSFEKRFGAKYASFKNLLKNSDIVSLHTSLTQKTKHLISKKELGMMKKGAILINTARGPIVEEKYLCEALHKNKLAGAGLDVYEYEPKISPYLKKCNKVILTPHSASATFEAREDMARVVAQNIIDFSKGKVPSTLINREITTRR